VAGAQPDFDERVRLIAELVKGPRVLNLGASGNTRPDGLGRRRFVQGALVAAGHEVLGADLNQAGVDWLRHAGYDAVWMDAQAIPPEGELFDSIVAGELIEHLESPAAFLQGCAARLAPGGRLILSTPQPHSPVHFIQYLVSPAIANVEHTCWYDLQTLGQLLERCGFEVEVARFVNDVRAEEGNWKLRLLGATGLLLTRLLPARFRSSVVVAARVRRDGPTRPSADQEHWQPQRDPGPGAGPGPV
jgi:SAM-dependent methyltransferase